MSGYLNLPSRIESREIEGSPVLSVVLADTLATGVSKVIDVAEDYATYKKYLPFNFTRIINNSDEQIAFYINQDKSNVVRVLSKTIVTLDKNISSFRITNESASTTSASEIIIELERKAMDSDKFSRDISKNVFVRALFGVRS